MQMDSAYDSTFGMDNPFVLPMDWVYDSIAARQFWNTPGTSFEGVAGYIDTTEIKNHQTDLASPSSSSTSAVLVSSSSGPPKSFTVGQACLAFSDVSGSSQSSDTHTSHYPYSSLAGPSYASSMMGSPEPLEPEGHYGFDAVPCCGGFPTGNLACQSPIASSNREKMAEAGLWKTPVAGTRVNQPRRWAEKPTARSRQASASGDEVFCPSCRRKFTSKASLHRHQKESCGSESGTRLFYCDPRYHPGCKKSFKRRCGLKGHYRKLGFSEREADAKVRERYGQGMHRRRI